MGGLLVFAAVVVALVAVVAGLYRRVGSDDWGGSDLRLSTLAFLAAIGPMFGVHVREQKQEPPALSDTKDDDDAGPGVGLKEAIAADEELQSPIPRRRRGRR